MADVKTVPEFSLAGTGGREISSADYKEKKWVLFFFPGAFTPTCSKECVDFERRIEAFRAAGAEVLGVSVDSKWTLDVFSATSGGLSYPLASDLRREVGTRFGVFLPEKGYEARAIFVIGKDGSIKWSKTYDLKTTPDLNEVLEAVKKA
jgi:peroxiredoxin